MALFQLSYVGQKLGEASCQADKAFFDLRETPLPDQIIVTHGDQVWKTSKNLTCAEPIAQFEDACWCCLATQLRFTGEGITLIPFENQPDWQLQISAKRIGQNTYWTAELVKTA